jgi:predicted RNA-binding Zn ribbon-like protein
MTKATRRAKQPHVSPSTHGAIALRGALALDLINTEIMDRGKPHDTLPTPEALARWWEAACERYPDQCIVAGTDGMIAWTSELFDAVLELRRTLRTLITEVVESGAVEEESLKPVNAILALGYSALERTGKGSVKPVMRLCDPEKGSVLLPIALSALRLFSESDWRRLHQCKNDRCILFFYDTTKNGARRWCSAECMNRARSIHQYQLAKKKSSHMASAE